ncbi:helix-turn-helix transcriptional regulator [Clostridium ganghwense]|uniref:PAS domain-containing protein n=1 Tax=Clostridium ganghwense TaxID=312089 RepID=A0ABT4CXV7_9CLOT|nr:PAS domain-containing protein [Clostridium ganghwense]MCY6372719.1 PAS domain-containing protein [Clostridium ganghwense]
MKTTMSDDQLLQSYMPLVHFLGEALGSTCEIALHDVRNPDNSLIAITNNDGISRRSIGSPLTDFGLKIMKEKNYKNKEFITKYPSKTTDGKILRSSSFFIKNNDNEVIGLLCINVNISDFIHAANFLNKFLSEISGGPERNLAEEKNPLPNNLSGSMDELLISIIENTMAEINVPPERMSPEEKMSIVHKLDEKGVFLLKGAVGEVAEYLKTSENTIYRYINKKD